VVQQAVVYAIVAGAAGWTIWSLFLRGWVKRRRAAGRSAKTGSDCACGD